MAETQNKNVFEEAIMSCLGLLIETLAWNLTWTKPVGFQADWSQSLVDKTWHQEAALILKDWWRSSPRYLPPSFHLRSLAPNQTVKTLSNCFLAFLDPTWSNPPVLKVKPGSLPRPSPQPDKGAHLKWKGYRVKVLTQWWTRCFSD